VIVTILPDTQLILWAFDAPALLSMEAESLIANRSHRICFSAATIWEVAIKNALNKPDFAVDPETLREGLLDNGYLELPITSAHAAAVCNLPPIHKDPFDRILVAQAMLEGITLLTTDRKVAKYPGPIRKV
jgi:PIN domain nuclease of toxin-antitoxin system